MGSTRAGRKRKTGVARHPGGKIVQARQYENPQAVAALGRLRQHVDKLVLDDRFGTHLGRMALFGDLQPEEYDAALSWAELKWRHGQIVGLMMPMCKAINWEGSQGKSLKQPPSEEEIERIKARMADADKRMKAVSYRAIPEFTSVVICDEEPADRALIRRVCQALVAK